VSEVEVEDEGGRGENGKEEEEGGEVEKGKEEDDPGDDGDEGDDDAPEGKRDSWETSGVGWITETERGLSDKVSEVKKEEEEIRGSVEEEMWGSVDVESSNEEGEEKADGEEEEEDEEITQRLWSGRVAAVARARRKAFVRSTSVPARTLLGLQSISVPRTAPT